MQVVYFDESSFPPSYVVPDSVMLWELLLALSVIFRVWVNVPVAVGANVTLIVQVLLAWTVAPEQLVVAEKGALRLLIAGLANISGVVPVFVTVIDTVLLLPFGVIGKVSLLELKPLALKLATGLIT